MMKLTERERNGLDVLLNEADLLGFEVNPGHKIGAATLNVLTLHEAGPAPSDSRYQFLFYGVMRVVASLRETIHEAGCETLKTFPLDQLLGVVRSFGGHPIYGWSFIDVHEKTLAEIAGRISLDWHSGDERTCHSMSVFQEADGRMLDLCVWFKSLEIRNPRGASVPLDVAVTGCERWWDAMYVGCPDIVIT